MTKKTTITTREYDEKGNILKETITETEERYDTYPSPNYPIYPIYPSWDPNINPITQPYITWSNSTSEENHK